MLIWKIKSNELSFLNTKIGKLLSDPICRGYKVRFKFRNQLNCCYKSRADLKGRV